MENDTLFYIFGIALIVAAVVLGAIGLRAKEFPSGPLFGGVIAVFAVLIVGTGVFAVRSAGDEQHEREENERAEAEEEAAGEAAGVAEADQPGPGGEAPDAQGINLMISSPADGSLSFEPKTLDAKPGTVTIDYDNPSPVPHNIALEGPGGEELAESETGANGVFAITSEVEPGEYVYFCAVPGHREGGMEGTLTVK